MPSLTHIKEVLAELLRSSAFGPHSVPEKVTTYGGPSDNFTKIVETFTVDDEGTMHVNRSVQYKEPIDFISLKVVVGAEVPEMNEQE